MNIVAVLEVMWGWCGLESAETQWFSINPDNFTGKRLYKMIGEKHDLLVTNACKECVETASGKGIPDPVWLRDNVAQLKTLFKPDLILICGKVPLNTWKLADISLYHERVIVMPHPAARSWTNERMYDVNRIINTCPGDWEVTLDEIKPLEMTEA